jgi:hypothetical protein
MRIIKKNKTMDSPLPLSETNVALKLEASRDPEALQ